jgi:hypothetical protein
MPQHNRHDNGSYSIPLFFALIAIAVVIAWSMYAWPTRKGQHPLIMPHMLKQRVNR